MLGAQEAARLEAAALAAFQIGLPLGRFITIHWQRAGLSPNEGAAATRAFIKLARNWLEARGKRYAYVWVRENDYGDGKKGDHVHMLWHVPDGISFRRHQLGWIKRITGQAYRSGAIMTKTVGGHAAAPRVAPEHYLENLATVTAYALKGAPDASSGPNRAREWGEGGRVIGQRSGMSRNLSRIVRPHSVSR